MQFAWQQQLQRQHAVPQYITVVMHFHKNLLTNPTKLQGQHTIKRVASIWYESSGKTDELFILAADYICMRLWTVTFIPTWLMCDGHVRT